MIEQKNTPDEQRICLTVEQASKALGLSRPTMLELTHTAGFPCFRIGRRVLIPRRALLDWLDRQAAEGARL